MSKRRLMIKMKLPVLTLLVVLFGCSSPLLDVIEEEVEVIQTPPSITSIYPAADSSSVSIDDDIQIVFTKRIQSSSVTSGTFIIEDEYGDITTGTYTVSSDTVTFSPNKLYYDTVYTITATSGILDTDGNSFGSDFSWTFETQAAPASVKPIIDIFHINNGKSATSDSEIEITVTAKDYLGGETGLQTRYKLETESEWSEWIDLENGTLNISETLAVSSDDDEDFIFKAEVRDTNKVVSLSSSASIQYKTSPPDIDPTRSNPAPSATDSQNKTYVKIAFNSEMDTSTITHESVYILEGATKITTFLFENVDNNTAVEFTEFEHSGSPYELEEFKSYTVFISSSVTDIAGNPFTKDTTYTFTNGPFDDFTPPSGQIVLNLDESQVNATASPTFDLMIKAEDFSGVRSVKVWGDSNNSATYPYDEQDASWKPYSEGQTTPGAIDYMSYALDITGSAQWSLNPAIEGNHYIYYKFRDYANNESSSGQNSGILIISLDVTAPSLSQILVNGGSDYVNSEDGVISISLIAEDITTAGNKLGSGLNRMWITSEASSTSNPPASETGDWDVLGKAESWLSLVPDYSLEDGEGQYFIHAEVEDFVANVSGVTTKGIILDYTDPFIEFSESDILEVNTSTVQTVSLVEDKHPADDGILPDPLAYQIPSGIDTYLWEQDSGPGTLIFSDPAATNPSIGASQSDGSEDGMYEVRLTVADNAGNTYSDTVDFYWDTIDPDDIGTISAFNADDSALTTSDNGTMVYTPSAQPYATWPASAGADFYIIIPYFEEFDPNTDPGVQYGNGSWYPHWDDDEVDWDDPLTFEDKNYIRQEEPKVSAPPPETPGQNDGPVYLYVSAWDDAGNRSNKLSDKFVKFHIDTQKPVVENLRSLPPSNSTVNIDYVFTDDSTLNEDGRVYDLDTPTAPVPGTSGSGLASYLWEQESGPGTLTIQNQTTLTPSVYGVSNGSEDGEYVLKLTVTDNAGHTNDGGYVNLVWDTTAPNPVTVTGSDRTPDRTPTWSWTTGGGGNGTYEYQLETDSGTVVAPWSWTETTDTFFTPGTNLTDGLTYVLFVREKDDAGNLSDETNVQSNHSVWVDTTYKTEPSVTLSGEYLRNASNRTVTWTLGSGILEHDGEYYRYWIENSFGNAVMYGSGGSANVIGPYNSGTASITEDLSALSDDEYTILVQEYDSVNYTYPDNAGWTSTSAYIGESLVEIDATAPNPPVNYAYNSGYNIYSNGYYLTNDTTPYLRWSTGGGGNGNYRWSFDETNWSYTTSIYVYPNVSEGIHTFYVQERDLAGNWSVSETYDFEVDVTPPTLGSILLKNRSLNAVNTTSYAVEPYVDIEVNVTADGNEYNAVTYPGGDIRRMVFWNSGGWEYTVYVSGTESTRSNWYFGTNGGSTADGSKYVYCKLIDYAGNESIVRYDAITLDTVPPTVTSFSINNNATTATSTSVTLNSAYSGANYMRISTNGGTSWSGWYSASSARTWSISSNPGAKKVMVEFSDYAGVYSRNSATQEAAHDTAVNDSIFYGSPVMNYSYKGTPTTPQNYIRTYYDAYGSDTGYSNTYEIWASTTPTGTKTLVGTTTNSSYFNNSSYYNEGTLYYIFVRVSNPAISGYSNYSDYSIGYGSNIAVIYDDDDTIDTKLAETLKYQIERNWSSYSNFSPQGSTTYVPFTVTIVPEDEVSLDYVDDGWNESIVYGDPIIITPSASRTYLDTGKARNIAASGRGIIAMYYAGSRFYETLVNNWGTWGLSGTAPTNLDQVYYRGTTQAAGTKEYYSQYEYIWHKYYYYPSLFNSSNVNNPDYTTNLFTTVTDSSNSMYSYGLANLYAIYNTAASGGSSSTATTYYADDPTTPNYYSIARQGRFVYYGYNKNPYYYWTGANLFYNIIRRMSLF